MVFSVKACGSLRLTDESVIFIVCLGSGGGQEEGRRRRNGATQPQGQSRRSYHHDQQVHQREFIYKGADLRTDKSSSDQLMCRCVAIGAGGNFQSRFFLATKKPQTTFCLEQDSRVVVTKPLSGDSPAARGQQEAGPDRGGEGPPRAVARGHRKQLTVTMAGKKVNTLLRTGYCFASGDAAVIP